MQNNRILFVITALNLGGAEMMLYRMLKLLKYKNYEIKVITLMGNGVVAQLISNELEIEVDHLNIYKLWHLPKAIIKYVRVLKEFKPNIVHSHMYHANIFTRIIRLLHRVPTLICTIHNLNEQGSKKNATSRLYLYRVTDRLANLTTQVSRVGLKKYLKYKALAPERSRYLPNGIDVSAFYNYKKDTNEQHLPIDTKGRFVFLAVGSLTPQKDYLNLLDSFEKIVEKNAEVILLIAGEGPQKTEIEQIISAKDLINRVYLLGVRKDIPWLMSIADAYVMSSAWEGLPIVLLEASASSLPLVVTDVGGNSEVVVDCETGYLVPPKNPAALAARMLQLMNLPPLERSLMGQKGLAHITEFYAIDKIVDEWESIYREFMAGAY